MRPLDPLSPSSPPACDPAAARSLAAVLVALADALERATRADAARRPVIGEDWRGCSRHWFDWHQADLHRTLRQVAAAARSEATAVTAAIAAGTGAAAVGPSQGVPR